jgi:hypothetical protein
VASRSSFASYQKLVQWLLLMFSRLDITVICALHKANPNALSSSEFVASAHVERKEEGKYAF